MKTIINKFLLFVTLFAGAVSLHGCSDPDGIIEDIAYDREFSPLNFTYTLTNNVNVAFSWTVMTGISDYTLTLSYTDGEGGVYDEVDLIAPLDGDGTTVKTMDYSFKELPGNREWKAELVAVSQRTGVSDSKPAVCLFATGIENLFLNDGKVSDEDITATTALLRWVAGSNVTDLNVTPGIGKVALTADQIAAGEYELTGLTTGTAYTVELLRDEAVRGTVTFVASDKIDVDVTDKSASAITLSWGADQQVTGLVLKGGDDERNITLTQEQIAAHTYTFEGLKERTEYAISVYIDGVESGNLVVTTLGQSSFWDFTDASKWPVANWESNQTIDGLTILAASGKNVQIQADADYGYNYLDLRGKSTYKEGEAPTQRAVQFSVVGEGVLSIDCYANGTGRNIYAYVDALGKAFGPFEAPTADNRGKVYIPCPGIPASAVVSIYTDATVNHIYSIGWYEGTEAPGQNATPLAAPEVTATPAEVTKGDSAPVTFSWAAVPNAATYTYRLALTTLVGETEEVVRLSETVSTTGMTVPAETVAKLKPGTYTISVTAAAASDYLYKPSSAGSATLTVNDTKLAAPVVKLEPAKVTVGDQTAVTASWEAIDGAASYDVTFNGGTPETVNTPSYTIAAAAVAALAVGDYTISVVANPADASSQASDAGTAKLTVADASTSGGDNFAWDFSSSAFSDLIARLTAAGSTGLSDVDETIEGLRILSGGASLRGGSGFIQSGGAGSTTKRVFSFTASASGKLKVVASNTGSSAATDGRSVTVQVGDDEAGAQSKEAGSGSGTPTTCEFDLVVSAETTIYIYPTNGLRFYSIEYVSEGGSGGDAGTAYAWGADDMTAVWAGFANSTGDINAAALATMTETADLTKDTDGFTYKGLSFLFGGGKFKFGENNDAAGTKAVRFQYGGTGSATKACVSFTVDAPGTLVVEAVSSSSSADRALAVSIDDTELTPQNALGSGATLLTFDCSSATAGSKITIYSKNSGINVFSIAWTPSK